MNINESMAEVMGWHKEHCDWFDGMAYVRELGDSVLLVNDWRPDTDLSQVMMCVFEAKNKHKLAFNF